MSRPILGLFGVFAPLSLVTVGGGQTIVASIQRQVVDHHGWLTNKQFLDAFAISRMAPGPGSLLATLLGWQVAGFWGAVSATIGIFGPTAILVYGIAALWARHRDKLWTRALEGGLRPVAAGMILASVYVLMRALEGGWLATVIALASTAALVASRVSPLLLLAAGAGTFIALHGLAGA